MLKSESLIAAALLGLSVYFMVHATVLPIGWVEGEGPGGGAFPFWLSVVMGLAAGGILVRSLTDGRTSEEPFFDPETRMAVLAVSIALVLTIAVIPFAGAYIALMAFLLWYLKIFGGRGWTVTVVLTLATPVFLFFFFEVTLKILLPKGWTEPFFFPLYARFF
ncbi:MAG: tripartite tricarboxylate transporter TctB family protein [Pseudomonadota bacterium]